MHRKLAMTTISSSFGVSEVRSTSHRDRCPLWPSSFFMLVWEPTASHTLCKCPTNELHPSPSSYNMCWIHKKRSKDYEKFPLSWLTISYLYVNETKTELKWSQTFICKIPFSLLPVQLSFKQVQRRQICRRHVLFRWVEIEAHT